jgi:MinD-like ATPase involved in chromosome partitioning or flagellar assembly
MYPLPAVLVNFAAPVIEPMRAALGDNAVTITNEFPSAEAMLAKWSSPPDTKRRLMVVRLRSLEDVQKMERLETCFPGWPLLAIVEGDYDASGLFRVSRAGASQILPMPFEKADFDAALDRLLVQFGLRETPCKVIAVSGVVEGCGATTVAVNLAAELATIGEVPCILTEMSFGIGRLAAYLNLSPTVSTRDLLGSQTEPNAGTLQAALVRAGSHLSVLAGQSRTLEPFNPPPGRIAQLFRLIRQISTFVVVDMPYTFDPHYFETITAADAVYLVARQDVPAIEGTKLIKQTLAERGVKSPGLLINQFNPEHTAFSCEAIGSLLQMEHVFPIAADPTGSRLASNAGKPLRQVVPSSEAVAHFRTVALSILETTGIHPHLPRVTLWDRIRTLTVRMRS